MKKSNEKDQASVRRSRFQTQGVNMQETKLGFSRLFLNMKQTIITPKVQSLFSKEDIGKLFAEGFEKLKIQDKEDSDYFKLRNLKGIVNGKEVWIIEDSLAVTLLLPEEY